MRLGLITREHGAVQCPIPERLHRVEVHRLPEQHVDVRVRPRLSLKRRPSVPGAGGRECQPGPVGSGAADGRRDLSQREPAVSAKKKYGLFSPGHLQLGHHLLQRGVTLPEVSLGFASGGRCAAGLRHQLRAAHTTLGEAGGAGWGWSDPPPIPGGNGGDPTKPGCGTSVLEARAEWVPGMMR